MKVKAHAKINLTLDVLRKDPSGYHRIQTVLLQIDLHDILIFRKIPSGLAKNSIVVKCAHPGVPKNNTVVKAVQLLQNFLKKKRRQIPFGIEIELQKNIPVAAGLGGASSDAAATLLAVNQLWKLKIPAAGLQKMAVAIGMDVPFFLQGGLAFADHYGEKITPLPDHKIFYHARSAYFYRERSRLLKRIPMLFIDPGSSKKTAEAYKQIDRFLIGQNQAKTADLQKFLSAANVGQQSLADFIHNDFNLLYGKKFAKLCEKMYELGAQAVSCSGSGPVMFAIFKTYKLLEKACKSLKKDRINGIRVQKIRAQKN